MQPAAFKATGRKIAHKNCKNGKKDVTLQSLTKICNNLRDQRFEECTERL
jgi:hypothetical protein